MAKEQIRLSDRFTYRKLIRFTLPSIVMMIFSSIYGVVDGLFVSNFASKTAFAAVNFIMPFLMMLGTLGFMFGTGGAALIGKLLGEKESERANRTFSMVTFVSILCGVLLAVLGIVFIEPVAALLGAEGQMLADCVVYGRIILAALPFFMLQMEFQTFFVVAEKPKLGLASTVASGVANMVLDALLVAVFGLDLVGAALATAISQAVGGIIPIVYFSCKNKSLLRLTARFRFDGRALLRVCTNGSSELMSNISMSLVSMLYNLQLIKYAAEDGVAAYGVLMYVNFIFLSAFIGYVVGMAPVVSYHYGAQNRDELKSLFCKSLVLISISSAVMVGIAAALAQPMSAIFVGYDQGLYEMTVRGFYIYSLSFLFSGGAIFGSSFFTALNNGFISAAISFLRTMVFQIAAVMLIPLWLELDGIWISIVVAELMAFLVTAAFLLARRKKYGYM